MTGDSMCEWGAIKELGAYLGLGVDDALVKKLASGGEGRRSLEAICRSMSVFSGAYPEDRAGLIVDALFDTDFSRLPREGGEEALSRDVFDRLQASVAFPRFDYTFQRCIRWFKASLTAVLYSRKLKKEKVSLDNPGIRHYLSELGELPCRRLEGLDFSRGGEGMGRKAEALLKKYGGRVLPEDVCQGIIQVMGRVSCTPGYYRTIGPEQKLAEARPILVAISALQLDPAKEPDKASLLSILGILLLNVYPSARLLKLVARLEPDPGNDELSYEYYSILAISHLLAGRLDDAASLNEKSLEHAMDEEKRAYTRILDCCIRLNRGDFEAAINALYNCFSMARDKRMRSVAQFYSGIIYYETGSISAAYECFQRAVVGLDGDLDAMSVYNNVGTCAMMLGDVPAAIKAFERVLQAGMYLGSNTAKKLKALAFGNLGVIHLSRSGYDVAMGYFKEALKLKRDLHDKKGVADELGNIGLALKMKRDYEAALEYFRSSLNMSFAGDYAEGVMFSFAQVEQIMALEGRYAEVERLEKDMIRRNPDIARILRF